MSMSYLGIIPHTPQLDIPIKIQIEIQLYQVKLARFQFLADEDICFKKHSFFNDVFKKHFQNNSRSLQSTSKTNLHKGSNETHSLLSPV